VGCAACLSNGSVEPNPWLTRLESFDCPSIFFWACGAGGVDPVCRVCEMEDEPQHAPPVAPHPGVVRHARAHCSWWTRLLRWQKVLIVVGSVVVLLAIIGGVVALNVAEGRKSLAVDDGTGPSAGGETHITPSGVTVPYGWTTFEGESISLSLPDSFEGGSINSPEGKTLLEQMAEVFPGSMSGSSFEKILSQAGTDLFMVKWPGRYTFGASVFGGGAEVPASLPLESYASTSLGALVGSLGLTSAELDVKPISEDRVHGCVRGNVQEGTADVTIRAVFIRAGSRICSIAYVSYGYGDWAMDDIFAISAETIVVREETQPTVVF
jgi:hypothetical protein